MSFSDAIGQIDQIVQWEQQLMDPAAAIPTASTGGTTADSETTSSTASDATTNATFAQTLAQAQTQDATTAAEAIDPTATAAESTPDPTATTANAGSLDGTGSSDLLSGGDSQLLASLSELTTAGTTATTTPTLVEGEAGASGGTATSPTDPRIEAMTEEANALVGKPYVWGGGHDGWGAQAGYDCSGFVSAVLHAGGYLTTPQDTTTLPSAVDMESGPGQYVTIYDRDKPGQQGHVIINIDGQFYEAGGEAGSWGGGGVEKISTPSAKYLSTFDAILHPAGL